ncbi:hypothetical protein T492DRAFT_1067567, partial [Pavlovales sp. CCMP2436]
MRVDLLSSSATALSLTTRPLSSRAAPCTRRSRMGSTSWSTAPSKRHRCRGRPAAWRRSSASWWQARGVTSSLSTRWKCATTRRPLHLSHGSSTPPSSAWRTSRSLPRRCAARTACMATSCSPGSTGCSSAPIRTCSL